MVIRGCRELARRSCILGTVVNAMDDENDFMIKWIKASCEAQGLPYLIEDDGVLMTISIILQDPIQ